jgi:mRNA-degrading endonuclease HigB of HigAB toxin-antitoxin module
VSNSGEGSSLDKAHIFNIDGHSYRLKDFNQTMKGAHLE